MKLRFFILFFIGFNCNTKNFISNVFSVSVPKKYFLTYEELKLIFAGSFCTYIHIYVFVTMTAEIVVFSSKIFVNICHIDISMTFDRKTSFPFVELCQSEMRCIEVINRN